MLNPVAPTDSHLPALTEEEWLALKSWLMGFAAHRALEYIPTDDKPDEYEPHHYIVTLKTRALAIARAHGRHDLVGQLRDPQPVSEKSIKRIREVVETLESLPLTITPKPDDPVTKWLPARAANPIAKAGIESIVELSQIALRPGWHREIKGLGRAGRKAAEELLVRLREGSKVLPDHRPPNVILQAWRALSVGNAPVQLDGRQGKFRGPPEQCTLEASDDWQAITTWLKLQPNEITRQSYRKELMRVLLWATTVRGRAFSSLTVEDAGEYRDFLVDPQPASMWVGPRRSIDAPDWRPFAAPLSESSRQYALRVIKTCARWLREQNYLLVNPWAAIRASADGATPFKLEKVPSQHHWKMVRQLATDLEAYEWEPDAAVRLRFMLDFLRGTGLRVSEFAGLRLGDIYQGEPGEWFVRVFGKGSKVAVIDLLPVAKSALEKYLVHRGLSALIDHNDPGIPVVSSLEHPSKPVTRKQLWSVIDRFRKLAVIEFEGINKNLSKQLAALSPHTLRHIFGSHALANGAQLKDVQDGLRHANIRTTSGYVHSDTRKRRKRLTNALT